jgi:hypothetical protein
LGYDNWANKPDSANISGFNHSLNFYFMMDFPFKTDQRLSIGVGAGLGSSQIYFNRTYPLIANNPNVQQLVWATSAGGASGGDHYKRFKLVTNYFEIPVELRFALDPEHMDKSWKFAIGTKIGYLLTAYTKGVDPQSSAGGNIGGGIVDKESSKQYFSSFKFEPTIRVSKGVIGIFGQFQANSLIKGSAGYSAFPFAGGIVLSGL